MNQDVYRLSYALLSYLITCPSKYSVGKVMGIGVALVHESVSPSRFRNLSSPHRKAGIVVGIIQAPRQIFRQTHH